HALFFAVRDRPDARDWRMIRAVGSGPWNEFAGPQPAGLWKYAAFSGGARALDVVYAITMNQPFPDWVRDSWPEDAETHDRRLRLRVKLTLALTTARSPGEVEKLIAARDQLDRLDRPTTGRAGKQSSLLRLQARWLGSMGRRGPAGETFGIDPPGR